MIRLTALAVFCLALTAYLLTVAPTISWRNGGIDSGELVTAIVTLGIPHPTGFPTYMLVGYLVNLIPVGEPAYRVNLGSALFGALTAAVISTIICLVAPGPSAARPAGSDPFTHAGGSRGVDRDGTAPGQSLVTNIMPWAALTAALILAFSPLFWSRSTIAKEYTLNLWFMSILLLCLLAWRRTAKQGYLTVFGVIFGLALGNHLTVLSVLPASLAFVGLMPSKNRPPARWSLLIRPTILAVLVAAVAYSYLPIRAAQHPLLNWDNPATINGFLAHLTGSAYLEIVTVGDPSQVLRRIAFAFSQIPSQYSWAACVCLLTGAWTLASRDRPIGAFAVVLAGENILFASVYPTRDSDAYLLPAYLVGSIAVGVGLTDVMSELQAAARRLIPALSRAPWLAPATLAALLIAFQLQTNFAGVDVSRDTTARDYAFAVLRSVEPGSVVLTNQDATTFSLWYVWQVLRLRPDVVVVDERLLDWNWYRESVDYSYPGLHLVDPTSATEDRLQSGQASGRPVYRARVLDLSLRRVVEPVVDRIGP